MIEDSCHAFGSKYIHKNKKYHIGCCKHSDMSTFSFHPLKTITTGEGGLISTNSKKFSKKIKYFRSHGIVKGKKHWNYNVKLNGYNLRLSDINSALGCSQIKKMNNFISWRKKIFKFYKKEFSNFQDIKIIDNSFQAEPSYHLMIILIDFSNYKINKDQLINQLMRYKIFCQFHYKPIFLFNAFKLNNTSIYPNSKKYLKNALSIPIYYKLKLVDAKFISKKIKSILLSNLKFKKIFHQ